MLDRSDLPKARISKAAGRSVYIALDRFCESDSRPLRLLAEAGFEIRRNTLGRRLRAEEMPDALQGVHAVVAGLEPYGTDLLDRLPDLQCISRCGSGLDSINLDAATRRGIVVFNTPDEVVEPVAQLTVAMILALARHLPALDRDLHQDRWHRRTGYLLSEWTIGLIGFGRIGRTVEARLRSFSPRILVADPALNAAALPAGVERRELAALLAESDLVSVHADRPRSAGPLLGSTEMRAMKAGAYLVNTARGYLVDEAALEACLREGRLAGCALDVFSEEPYSGPLARLPQVLCTPHVAALTRRSRQGMEQHSVENVIRHFMGAAQQGVGGLNFIGGTVDK